MKIDFKKIYDIDLQYQPGCHTLCSSCCCTNFSTLLTKTKILKKNHIQLHLLPGEYQYVKNNNIWGDKFKNCYLSNNVALPNNRIMTIESVRCSLKGHCQFPRPVICRIYPFMPTFNSKGDFIGVDSYGLYDKLMALLNTEHHCKIINKTDLRSSTQLATIAHELSKDCLIIFYLMSSRIYLNNLVKTVKYNFPEILKLQPVDFFVEFEKLVLRNKVHNWDQLKTDIIQLYEEFKAYWGDSFNLPHK